MSRYGNAGGGIFAIGGSFYMKDTEVDNNKLVYLSSAQSGGGIFVSNPSYLSISDTQIRNNTTGTRGGGIYIKDYTNDFAELTNLTITGNVQPITRGSNFGGGGIYSGSSNVSLSDSTVSNNTAVVGGGIFTTGAMSIYNSTLDANQANGGPGGGIYNDFSDLNVRRSTISNNSASSGGGLSLQAESTEISNSTISSNSNSSNSGGIENAGGYLTLFNSTVAFNGSNGIQNQGSALMRLSNSVLSDNIGNDCEAGDYSRVFRSGNNLVQTNLGCTAPEQEFSVQGVSANLSELQVNGGPTLTHGLCPRSPAIDAGDQNQCATGNTVVLVDQRLELRNDGICDIGSFELLQPLSCSDGMFFVIPLKNKKSVTIEL